MCGEQPGMCAQQKLRAAENAIEGLLLSAPALSLLSSQIGMSLHVTGCMES